MIINLSTNREAFLCFASTSVSFLKESMINIKPLEKWPFSTRLTHQIAMAILAIASGILLYHTIKYFCHKVTLYSQFRQDKANLEEILQAWLQDDKAIGGKNEACNRIRKAFQEQETCLCLSSHNLNKLPPIFPFFKCLEALYLTGNQIIDIPTEIGYLTQLEYLHLEYNQIIDIPAEIGDLKQLKSLYLDHNQITNIPAEIGQLTQLEYLKLDHNQITDIPTEIGQLTKLTYLNIEDNPSLDELPPSLGQLNRMYNLSVMGTRIDPSVARSFEQAWKSARDEFGHLTFIEHARLWIKLSKENDDLADQWQETFSKREKAILNEWLLRLESTRDFGNNQKNLAAVVCQMIEATLTCSSFSDSFWVQVEANNTRCEDRAAMALNELYTSYVIHTLPQDATLQDKLHVMQKAAKTLALRRILATLIDEEEKDHDRIETESVEIFLYYESQLQKQLDLLTAIQNMRYKTIGKRDWIDSEELIQQVNDSYLDDLIQLEIFKEIVKENNDFQKACSALEKTFSIQLEQLENAEPKDSSSDSEEYLNWNIQMNQLMEEQNQAEEKLKKKWFLDHC